MTPKPPQDASLVGCSALWTLKSKNPEAQSGTPELSFPVKIADQRLSYGTLRVLIEPVGGRGQWWVNAESPALSIER